MIDVEHAVIVDVEATPARTYDEVTATRTMIDRTETTFGLKPGRLATDTAYGPGKLLAWLLDKDITPHIPVKEMHPRRSGRSHATSTKKRVIMLAHLRAPLSLTNRATSVRKWKCALRT